MPDNNGTADPAGSGKADWIDLFRDGRGVYTVLINLGIGLHALDIFIITTIMPTVVADIGGLAYYTWAAMLYTVGSIAGAACGAHVRSVLGRRRGYSYAGIALLIGTVACAVAPDMTTLLVARFVKGVAGGLVIAQTFALISELYDQRLRTRMLATITTTWSVAALIGPAVGGVFAEIGWWRGSFWATAPFIIWFSWMAWRALPIAEEPAVSRRLPWRRLALLMAGVMSVGVTSQVDGMMLRGGLIVLAVVLVWATFRLDQASDHALFPSRALSLSSPVGLAYWVYITISVTHTTLLIFAPLFLQVLHGMTPLYVGYLALVFSIAWTAGSLGVAGWTGNWQRFGAVGGMALAAAGTAALAGAMVAGPMTLITLYIILIGLGVGATNVIMTAYGMAAAREGEESVTASSMPTIRSLGVAFGAAISGLVANTTGLDQGITPDTVASVAVWVLGMSVIAPALGALFALRALVSHPVAADSG